MQWKYMIDADLINCSTWKEVAGQETHGNPGGAGHSARVQDQPLPAHAEEKVGKSQDGRHAQV